MDRLESETSPELRHEAQRPGREVEMPDKFWKETKDYKTYREELHGMVATASQGLKDYGTSAVWANHAAVFGLAMNHGYMLFAFSDLGKAFTATGQSVDEALESMVRQLEQCEDLNKEISNERQ